MRNLGGLYLQHLEDKTLAIVDIETTGMSAVHERIIEIGIIRIEKGRVVRTYESLINPEKSLTGFIQNVTGIGTGDLEHAPLFEDVAEEILGLLQGAVFVAHNARFDYGFIKNEFRRLGVSYNAKCLCSVRLSRRMFPKYKKHDLSSIIDRFDLVCEARHRAFGDAKAVLDFMQNIQDSGRGEEMANAINILLQDTSFPPFLDERTVKNLPNGPGVYIFYGSDNEVLYVGKSKNLKYRVLSHFSNDNTMSKEMNISQKTKRVEVRETAGEFGALLLESKLVKEFRPTYNRQLQKKRKLVIARKAFSGEYLTAHIERVDRISLDAIPEILGIFRSEKQAEEFLRKVSKEEKLCPKILGLENTKGPCFYSQLGLCGGACMGKENVEAFNARFLGVFATRRLKSWPFAKPIVVEEIDEAIGRHAFILDNWCLIGEIMSDTDDSQNFYQPVFDYDSYKIFSRFLSDPSNRRKIKTLSDADFESLMAREELVVY